MRSEKKLGVDGLFSTACVGGTYRVSFKYHGEFCISLGNMAIFLTEGLLDLGVTSRHHGVGGPLHTRNLQASFIKFKILQLNQSLQYQLQYNYYRLVESCSTNDILQLLLQIHVQKAL